VLRAAVWTLRQRRYAGLAVGMFIVALICVAAGSWQISRFEQSVGDNDALNGNARAAAVPLTTALVPLVDHGSSPGPNAIRFRAVTASGTYVAGVQEFVRNESLNGTSGYYVLNPLRTATGVLLVVRGFVAGNVADDGTSTPPATVTAPPSDRVLITGRLQTAGTAEDGAGELANGEIESINPAAQAARLGAPVYDSYVTLNANQPGATGVSVVPDPDLSNPAGGAYEWQHFAYIIQWYLFALLALAAPFVIGRHEVREAQRRFLGIDPGNEELGIESGNDQDQWPQLTDGVPSGGVMAVRDNGTLARAGDPTLQQWQRAARLADRYGRSLGIGQVGPANQSSSTGGTGNARIVDRGHRVPNSVPSSATRPHRSYDAYHGSYNDYLWQLGLADGTMPSVFVARTEDSDTPSLLAPNNSTLQPGDPAPSTFRDLEDEQERSAHDPH
jgi:cytochrome oxidase assembly protein ShyY1